MNQIVTTGIVLRRINYSESDRIITYITPDMGKISLIAKGARKPKSKLAGGIELFGESQMTFILGRGEIGSLISARLIQNYGSIVKDLVRTNIAYQIIKLINKYLESAAGGEFYNLVKEAYINLNDTNIDSRITQIWFGLNFLVIMGYQPKLVVEVASRDILNYDFDLSAMEFIENINGEYTRNDIKFLRLVQSKKPVFLSKVQSNDQILQQLSNLLTIIMRSNGFEYQI